MRIAVFGGTYSNPYALEAVLADAERRGCDRRFFLGDIGGFGADPNALWPLLTGGSVECIAGNYDVAIANGENDCGCGYRDLRDNEFAAIAFEHTRTHTSPALAAWMGTLPPEHRETIGGVDVHMVHGSPLGVNDFFWESLSDDQARARLEASGADVVFCTHSGLPWQRWTGGRLAVNVGVIGRPANDGRRDVWYAVVDLGDGQVDVELVPVAYDWQAQAASMRAAGLPEAFVETIETGWWTSCLQVLPAHERAAGRYQLYRSELDPEHLDDGLGDSSTADRSDDRPVVPLFGSALFPRRLWIASSVRCPAVLDEAAAAGFVRVEDADDGASVQRVAGPADQPELTLTGAGFRWHPRAAGPGAVVGGPGTTFEEAKRLVIERVLTDGQGHGRLPLAVTCAL
jgi:diadenosine tetraphosphatase ApaH/serine/threonine PP2A family protein phosphatase